ncbi:MAG: VCBS repeat-containing protein, partial [Nitrospiraceae bacterium]
ISVADYNNDGLLDVYLGGYAGAYLAYMELANERALAKGETPTDRIPWLSEEESKKIFQLMRSPDAHPISNIPGPPNWLLENLGGGRFRRAENSETASVAFNTMATGWSDIDRDGDMDLYVVNEGGPNQLLNNSGGTFTDISNKDSGEIGFGMGVSFGDYDNDGRTDVYTTNMFSKAGTRIAEQMQSSEIVAQSARGNSLIRNGPDGFYKVSGLEPPALQVEAADFGWGGSFADLNNDGHLDIYVPAGLYSMPAEVATIGDS